MAEKTLKEVEQKMQKALEATKDKLGAIRAGRANISMLDNVMIDYYGNPAPVKQVANVSAPEARLLTVDPWDKGMIKDIEKAIMQSNLGLTPSNDGKIIRMMLPDLTTERRKEYVKLAKKEVEDGKVAVRNIRKDANNSLRKLQKDSEITEDDLKVYETKIQEITDKYIKMLDEVYTKKEKEITTV